MVWRVLVRFGFASRVDSRGGKAGVCVRRFLRLDGVEAVGSVQLYIIASGRTSVVESDARDVRCGLYSVSFSWSFWKASASRPKGEYRLLRLRPNILMENVEFLA